ncbi:ABC transporter ATP-binding protein [Fusibacter sp. JL298sf-3]
MMKNKFKRKYLSKILKHSWDASPKTFLALIAISLVFSLLKYFDIKIMELLISRVVNIFDGQPISVLYTPMIALAVLLVLNPVVELLEFLAQGYFWRRGSGHLKSLFHKKVSKMDLVEFEDNGRFDQLEKANIGNVEAPDGIRILVQVMFLYIPFFLVVVVYLFTIKPLLVALLFSISIPLVVTEWVRMNRHYDFEDNSANIKRKIEYYEKCITSKEMFKETLQNKSYPFFNNLMIDALKTFSRAFKVSKLKVYKVELLLSILNIAGYIGVIALLVKYLIDGIVSVGEFAAIYYSIDRIVNMLNRLISDIGVALVNISSTTFLIDFLDEDEKVLDVSELSKNNDIKLKNVSFRYPNSNKNAVSNINLEIKKGTSLAIVGENGSGKTTLTKLILGLYTPTKGCIAVGDKNTSDYATSSRFHNVSSVFQNFIKYKLDVKDNVTISNLPSNMPLDQVMSKVNLPTEKLKAGEKTILAKEFGGQELSGGQWQRLAIARGIFRPHELIALDEPTSAIDPIEEEHIFTMFDEVSKDKTSILVTHRLGSVKMADRIIVMDSGEIVEQGRHRALIEEKGKYYELFQSQAKWYVR